MYTVKLEKPDPTPNILPSYILVISFPATSAFKSWILNCKHQPPSHDLLALTLKPEHKS